MTSEYFDVVIVGAGLSGIGAAYHLQEKCPDKSYVVLEGRDAIGGTWDLFRYPGIRSDSDMFTLGYKFKPWGDSRAIVGATAILKYLNETAVENGIDQHIRYRQTTRKATWSSAEARWTIEVHDGDTHLPRIVHCSMLLMCTGYYRYDRGYTPEFAGQELFKGKIIHPQHWPENLDYNNKKIVVIGSGSTAMTLIPAMAQNAGLVVMLQRSPSYLVSMPDTDSVARFLFRILPTKTVYSLVRWKNLTIQQFMYRLTRRAPKAVKRLLLKKVRSELGPEYDVNRHFTPQYNPWDQRLCLVPDGDFFQAIRSGKASVVTDEIDSFTDTGILLKSGRTLDADIIVTATGLELLVLGGIEIVVDNKKVNISERFSYKAMMFSDVPNLISTFGYVNAPWTLKADLTAEYACRLINHMDKVEKKQCTPRLRGADKNMPANDWITDFSSGYFQRMMHILPRQGDHGPWLNTQDYALDKKMIAKSPIADGVLEFSSPVATANSLEIESDAA